MMSDEALAKKDVENHVSKDGERVADVGCVLTFRKAVDPRDRHEEPDSSSDARSLTWKSTPCASTCCSAKFFFFFFI